MGKRIKKLLALLLVVSICAAYVSIPVQASGLKNLKAVGATVEVDGTNSTRVTVSLSTSEAVSLYGIQGTWSTSEEGETNYLKMTGIGSDVLTFTGMNDADPDSGYVIWGDDTFGNPAVFDAEGKVLTATYEVAAGTPAGEYTVSFTTEYILDGDFNEAYEVRYTATITVVDPNAPVTIVFPCGIDGDASHSDGSAASTYTQTVNGYELTLTGANMYPGGRDAKGNGCVKLGTSSKAGSFNFTVPDDVTSVIIEVAAYKANSATVTVNGTKYVLAGKSNDGTYDKITVDTSTNKTVSFEVTSGNRAMLNTVTYVITSGGSGETPVECTHPDKTHHDAVPSTCKEYGTVEYWSCPDCGKNFADEACTEELTSITATELADHDYKNGVCTICGDIEVSAGRYYIATKRSSGNYFYMTNSLGTATTERYQAVDSGLTELPVEITAPESDKIFVLVKNEDGTYSIYAEGITGDAKYLGWTSGNSGALVEAEDALKLTVDLNDGIYNIHFTASDAERYLSLNATAGNNYFAWYQGTQKQDLVLIPVTGEVHTHAPTLVPGRAASCSVAGYKEYYECSCGKLYEDAAATTEITDLDAWKAEGGSGYIAATGAHNYVPGTYTWSDDNRTCAVTGTCGCGATTTATANATSSTTTGTCQTAAVVTYTADFAETWAVDQEKVVTGETNPANHTGTDVTYTNNGDTHSATYDCCDVAYVTDEEHSYDENTHKCVCGDVEKFELYVEDIEGRQWWINVPYGENFMDYIPAEANTGRCYIYDDTYKIGYDKFIDWEVSYNDVEYTGTTMPAGNVSVVVGTVEFYGWFKAGDNWLYSNGSNYLTGWTLVNHADYLENGTGSDWYYLDPETYYRAEGTTRVPYPTVAINGVTYGANAEDKAYWETNKDTSKYTDADSALFIFDENGKFQQTTGIVDGNRYAVNGMIGWHVGLVKVDGEYYYFGGDVNGNGNIMMTGNVYATRNTTDLEIVPGGIYTFGSDGKLCKYDGITEIDGKLYYYEDYRLAINAGLVKIDGSYYYVRSSGDKAGQVVVSRSYWVANTNGLLAAGMYTFDADGKIIMGTESEGYEGIVKIDGKLYYYKGGVKQVGAGVVELTDENGEIFYIYVKSNGELATGIYWPTTLNGLLDRGAYDWGTDGRYYPSEG